MQALEKGWVGNGTGRQIGDQDDEEDVTPRTELKKHSPTQRSVLACLYHHADPGSSEGH